MTTERITSAVAARFNVSAEAINGRSLDRRVCLARAVVFYVLCNRLAYTSGQVAKMLGRDPVTVWRNMDELKRGMDVDAGLRAMVEDVMLDLFPDRLRAEYLRGFANAATRLMRHAEAA
jgi:chromosomal replication initiation ATPase DnaA